jgi:hypothetical protein
MSRRSVVLFSVLGALSGSTCLAQTEFHRQEPIIAPGGYSSQDARNKGGLGWFSEVVDNFPGTAGTIVNEVQFWGGYVTPIGQEGRTRGFTLLFYADDNGRPGTRLFQQDVPEFNETVYQDVGGFGMYSYSLRPDPPFAVDSSAQYWVGVVAILDRGGDSQEPQWGWVQAAPGWENPPTAWSRFFTPEFEPIINGVDMSFVVLGTTGGEPCACDWNADDDLNSQDFFDFLADFFASPADFNNDKVTNSQDFFDFLACFFAGC